MGFGLEVAGCKVHGGAGYVRIDCCGDFGSGQSPIGRVFCVIVVGFVNYICSFGFRQVLGRDGAFV